MLCNLTVTIRPTRLTALKLQGVALCFRAAAALVCLADLLGRGLKVTMVRR